MADEKKRPKVGVGVFVERDGKYLLGKRKGAHGAGEWSLPGGHLEWFESFEDCCRREVLEEAGLQIRNINRLSFTNDTFPVDDLHYVTLFFVSEHDGGEAEVKEPDKCYEWGWFPVEGLPSPLFPPLINLFEYLGSTEPRLVRELGCVARMKKTDA